MSNLPREWRIGVFWSSPNHMQQVRMLVETPERIAHAEKLRSFCYWEASSNRSRTEAEACGEIIAALRSDEKGDGYDLRSGVFGPKFSELIRRWAALENLVVELQRRTQEGQS